MLTDFVLYFENVNSINRAFAEQVIFILERRDNNMKLFYEINFSALSSEEKVKFVYGLRNMRQRASQTSLLPFSFWPTR